MSVTIKFEGEQASGKTLMIRKIVELFEQRNIGECSEDRDNHVLIVKNVNIENLKGN